MMAADVPARSLKLTWRNTGCEPSYAKETSS
jgi:hypothetical protein